uniref:Uncharacterized protein n=1 Tax=Meloidogyne enterolobii TaxID=390850 RepID=A0A6V7XMN4_MELEN|nr:unnamed protein product [Meloidogyne enterolobii]
MSLQNILHKKFVLIIIFIFLIILTLLNSNVVSWYEEGKTRSLTGSFANSGSNDTTTMVLKLMKLGIVEGYAIRRIKMFNDRVYLDRYRRSYWFGDRYYALDNKYFLETRETCAYRMRDEERKDLEYEEQPSEPILDIIYQCQRYVQHCCGLDCCNIFCKI